MVRNVNSALKNTKTTVWPNDLRPIPTFSIDFPEEWTVLDYPGCLLAASNAGAEGDSWLNTLISHERIAVGGHDEAFLASGSALAAKYDDLEIDEEQTLRFDDDDHYLARQSRYTDPDVSEAVTRLDISLTSPNTIGDTTEDLFTLSFISPTVAAKSFGESIFEIVRSMRFSTR